MKYYDTIQIDEQITAIKSLSGEYMYLINGSKKSVLIDTCIGLKGLRSLVESITSNPYDVLISHGHIDHAMGAPEFDQAYMNLLDRNLYQSQLSISERRGYAGIGLGFDAEKILDEEFVPETPDYPFLNLKEGMKFDLGDLTVEVYNANGHTPGSMVFLIPEKGILITGDAANNATFLFDDICYSVEDYQKSMEDLLSKVCGRYNRVFVMHHIIDGAPDTLEQIISLCKSIKEKQVDNIPFSFMGKSALVAKAANERMERLDGKFSNIIYNPERIFS